jgi:hypothetical protein
MHRTCPADRSGSGRLGRSLPASTDPRRSSL